MNDAHSPAIYGADGPVPAEHGIAGAAQSLRNDLRAGRADSFALADEDDSDFASLDAPNAADAGDPPAQPLLGIRILAVDDSLDALESLSMLLRLEGAEVTAVSSAAAALDAADRVPFDLLLSDVTMPVMDGHELVAVLRARSDTARLPAIALTGFGRPQDARQALDAGFDAHICKPVRIDCLLETVARLLDSAGSVVRGSERVPQDVVTAGLSK